MVLPQELEPLCWYLYAHRGVQHLADVGFRVWHQAPPAMVSIDLFRAMRSTPICVCCMLLFWFFSSLFLKYHLVLLLSNKPCGNMACRSFFFSSLRIIVTRLLSCCTNLFAEHFKQWPCDLDFILLGSSSQHPSCRWLCGLFMSRLWERGEWDRKVEGKRER